MALQGFDKTYYLGQKLAAVKAASPAQYGSWTTAQFESYLVSVGFTAESHYMSFGWAEGFNPNAYFNRDQYTYAKGVQMAQSGGSYNNVLEAMAAFRAAWPFDAYQHYLMYGASEGIDPSNSFDESAYLADKLADLQASSAATWGTRDVAYLRGYLAANGFTALTHYLAFGATEGNGGPYPVASLATLTNSTDIFTANVFNAGQVWSPGGDDRINALQDEDQLTGIGTNPTLNATLGNANDNGAGIITPHFAGIEVVNVAFTGSGAAAVFALDVQDATGLTDAINITRVSQAINFAEVGNIMNSVTEMSLTNTNSNQAGVVEFSYNPGALSGLNSSTMILNNVAVAALNIGQNTSGIGAIGVGTAGYETLAIQSNVAPNTIGTLNVPMDTGTAGAITITGSQNLTLATNLNITNAGLVEGVTHGGGIAQPFGRLATIDATGMTGTAALTLNVVAGLLTTGKADTSGVVQNVTITGTANNDTFYLNDTVQAGDSILGGGGTMDRLVVYTGGVTTGTGTVTSVESVDVQTNNAAVTLDFDRMLDTTLTNIRNIGNNGAAAPISADNGGNALVTLNNMSAAVGAALTIQHSTTTNGAIWDTTVQGNLKVSTNAADLVGITIAEGLNADPRFNFTLATNADLPATAATERVESITITDSDSESNTVQLTSFAGHTGTVTLTGGVAGTFINLDVDTAVTAVGALVGASAGAANAAAAAAVVAGVGGATAAQIAAAAAAAGLAGATAATVGQAAENATVTGLKQIGVGGAATDGTLTGVGTNRDTGWVDVAASATVTRLSSAVINAAGEAANVTVRVNTTAANANGGQSITMGSGADTVIFDDISALSATQANAGLTNADTVAGGLGADILVIDGNGINVVLQQSEWDNVSGFETIYLAGNGGGFGYFLQLDNDMIAANGVNGTMITIDNDNDSLVNQSLNQFFVGAANADNIGGNTAVRLDATTLSAATHFTYDGEEGAGATADRFIVNDQNTNGGNIINGGDVTVTVGVDASGVTRQLAGVQSGDVLEVRNTATVTTADLTNVFDVGNIVINNDQAVLQTLNLTLNSTVADALSDSGHTASLTEVEVLTITANDGLMADAAGSALVPTAASRIVLDERGISGAFALTITGDNAFAANDALSMALNLGGAAQTIDLNLGTTDTISIYGLNAAGTDTVAIAIAGAAQTWVFSNATGLATQTFNIQDTEIINLLQSNGTVAAAARVYTASAGADFITGTQLADTIAGLAGADTILAGAGIDNITGGTGADSMSGGAGVDTFNFAVSESVVASAVTWAGAVAAAADTMTFGNGIDIITDFTAGAGGDVINDVGGIAPVTGIGVAIAAGFLAGTTYFLSGNYVAATGVFTITADGVGADTLIVQGEGNNVGTANDSAVLLIGVDSDNLVAGNFA